MFLGQDIYQPSYIIHFPLSTSLLLQPFHSLVEVAYQQAHFAFSVDFKLSLSLFDGLLMRHGSIAF